MAGQDVGGSGALPGRERRQVLRARDILLADPASAPGLHALAAMVGSNRTKLNAGFRVVFGVPVYRFLKQQRMQRAAAMLRETSCSVEEIAHTCGFGHQGNFATAFRAYYGTPPSRWRARPVRDGVVVPAYCPQTAAGADAGGSQAA